MWYFHYYYYYYDFVFFLFVFFFFFFFIDNVTIILGAFVLYTRRLAFVPKQKIISYTRIRKERNNRGNVRRSLNRSGSRGVETRTRGPNVVRSGGRSPSPRRPFPDDILTRPHPFLRTTRRIRIAYGKYAAKHACGKSARNRSRYRYMFLFFVSLYIPRSRTLRRGLIRMCILP